MSTHTCDTDNTMADVKPKVEHVESEPLAASGSARAAPPDEYDEDGNQASVTQLPNNETQQDNDAPDGDEQKRTTRKAKKKSTKQKRVPKEESREKGEQKVTVKTPRSKRVARSRKILDDGHNRKLTDYFPVRRSARQIEAETKVDRYDIYRECIRREEEPGLKIVNSKEKGRCLYTTRIYERHDFVVEYRGDLISAAEAAERSARYDKDPDAGSYMYYFSWKGRKWCVDATAETHYLGRLANHSCKKMNCKMQVVECDGVPHVCLIALKTIYKDREILYDYGDRSKESLAAHPWLKE